MYNDKKIELFDMSSLLEGFEKKWVVISFDEKRVIASADSIEELSDRINEGIVMLVPDNDYLFAGKSR
ncbi:MAG: hypothetical protein IAE90_15820 [Ignavibacteria bacterium]|nr:hypothetical protein [Ignavibacteria bacterium]